MTEKFRDAAEGEVKPTASAAQTPRGCGSDIGTALMFAQTHSDLNDFELGGLESHLE